MQDKPISVGFNVPFVEAIRETEKRGVVLPEKYYGELQDLHRALSFSIAGVASLDQLQGALDSLADDLKNGGTFNSWQKDVRAQYLGLSKARLDNIYRTNIQTAYNRGRWEQYVSNEKNRPYLMYDAINDSRVRPSHLAMDGIIRRIDDPFWATNYPPNGFRCRCRCISLSEKQAQDRSKNGQGLKKPITPDMQPDKGWDYNVGEDLTAGIRQAEQQRLDSIKIDKKLKKVLDAKISKNGDLMNFLQFNTPKEAEKFLIENNIVDFADFGKIKDMAIINEWSSVLSNVIKEFPRLRNICKFTGSCQAQFELKYQSDVTEITKNLIEQGYDSELSKTAAKDYAKKLKVNEQLAHSWNHEKFGGIALNENYTDNAEQLKQLLLRAESTGFFPVGCASVTYVVQHEIGHQLDNLLDIRTAVVAQQTYNQLNKQNIIESEVSSYAATTIGEFIAECWAEFRSSSTPRITAKKIGNSIIERYIKSNG